MRGGCGEEWEERVRERRVRIEKGVRLVEREDNETKEERRRRVWL